MAMAKFCHHRNPLSFEDCKIYSILKLTSLVGECRRRRSRNQFSEDAVKSDFEEVCQGLTYPAVFVDVT